MTIARFLSPALTLPTLVVSLTLGSLPAVAQTGFLILGDAGTGKPEQYRVAASMRSTCQTLPCQFAIGLGDNIYEYGPNSAVDAQFQTKFEKPFEGLDMPFFMALGNHDNSLLIPGDGGFNQKGFYEVSYTANSTRWKMPARYYAFDADAGNAFFVAYDSNPPNAYVPPLWSPYWWPNGTYVKQQKAWITQTLAQSSATWKFAFAHHPFMSNGKHQKDPLIQGRKPYDGFVRDSLCGKVDFIFSGHEHALELLQPAPESCGNTVQAVSGAAAKNNGSLRGATFAKEWDSFERKWGYMHGVIDGSRFTLRAFVVDAEGKTVLAYTRQYDK